MERRELSGLGFLVFIVGSLVISDWVIKAALSAGMADLATILLLLSFSTLAGCFLMMAMSVAVVVHESRKRDGKHPIFPEKLLKGLFAFCIFLMVIAPGGLFIALICLAVRAAGGQLPSLPPLFRREE